MLVPVKLAIFNTLKWYVFSSWADMYTGHSQEEEYAFFHIEHDVTLNHNSLSSCFLIDMNKTPYQSLPIQTRPKVWFVLTFL
jgi:hypothetical protein